MTAVIGWASSLILLATLIRQVHKQWKTRSVEGVSKWLFVGQTAASVGFLVYSVRVHNWVFVVTNGALLINALVGVGIYRRNLRLTRNDGPVTRAPAEASDGAQARGAGVGVRGGVRSPQPG